MRPVDTKLTPSVYGGVGFNRHSYPNQAQNPLEADKFDEQYIYIFAIGAITSSSSSPQIVWSLNNYEFYRFRV